MSVTPSKECKRLGLTGLKELSEMTGQSPQTLNNWFKYKPVLFEIVLKGAMLEKYLK